MTVDVARRRIVFHDLDGNERRRIKGLPSHRDACSWARRNLERFPIDARQQPSAGGSGEGSGLAEARASVDRLVAVAAEAFERMRTSNSEEFLTKSRQTGGQ